MSSRGNQGGGHSLDPQLTRAARNLSSHTSGAVIIVAPFLEKPSASSLVKPISSQRLGTSLPFERKPRFSFK